MSSDEIGLRFCGMVEDAAAALDEGLVDLGELGGGHDHDVERDLAERAGDEAEEIDDFGKPVARNMPGRDRHAEAELLAQRLLDVETPVAERGERASGAREFADQDAGLQLLEPFGVAIEHCEPDRGLVAEGHRQGLLQMRAPGHRRVAIPFRQISEDAAQRGDIGFDDFEPLAHLQDHGGVHDVLRGRAPMDVAAGFTALLHHLMHQRQDRIADIVGLAAQQIEIERRHIRASGDLFGRLGRDHAAARLGPRQRDLDLGIAGNQRVVGKHLAHLRCAEDVAEKDGVQDGGGSRGGGLHGRFSR